MRKWSSSSLGLHRNYSMALGGFWSINISGEISPDARDLFVRFLKKSGAPNRIEVYLDSPGGSVTGAIELGRELRSRRMNTLIGKNMSDNEGSRTSFPGMCLSACSLVYVGGHFRWINENSVFGVHRFYFQEPSPDDADISQILSASIASYLIEMDISIDLMSVSTRAARDEMLIIPHNELRKLNVVNDGLTPVEWTMQSVPGSIYVRGERDTMFGHQKMILACDSNAKDVYLMSAFETCGRDEELMIMSRVDIELDGSPWLNVSDRAKDYRKINNNYLNQVIPINHSEARKIQSAQSIGLIFRFAEEAPMFLGISSMPVAGGRQLISGLLDVCKKP